ncbi:MAG: MFS transporter [Clostridia bacterium]
MKEKNVKSKITARNLMILWLVGFVGQLCWNVENQWFNTFVYAKISPDPSIIAWMTAVSAAMTTISTFVFGTMSDRIGKRRPFIFFGYIFWGLFTIAYGATEFLPKDPIILACIMVVAMDAVMSFFGSMGNDSGFNSWTTDISNEHNRGQLGGILAVQPVLATIIGTVISGMIIEHFGYFAFFIIIGIFVSVVGALGYFLMREAPALRPVRDENGFWHQFISVFNFKNFLKNKELFYVFFVVTAYFICFNIYFVHIGNYFIYTLGYSEGDAGLIQGVGLLIAVLSTIPATRFINNGKHHLVVITSIIVTIMGLLVLGFTKENLILIEIGIILVGAGYVLILQTTTAWVKNLYPENQRGQYEGIRILFFVLFPMIIGPAIASPIITRWGKEIIVNGIPGASPTGELFFFAAAFTIFTFIPLYFAMREKKRNLALKNTDNSIGE